jgi:hypothetical protein
MRIMDPINKKLELVKLYHLSEGPKRKNKTSLIGP